MGIHPYGLFGTVQSNTPFGSDYEIKRQLETRRSQLDALSDKENLSEDDIAKKERLENTINMLSSKYDKQSTSVKKASNLYSSSKSTDSLSKASTVKNADNLTKANNLASTANVSYNGKLFTEGTVIAKKSNDGLYGPNMTKEDNSYLKGFFVDLKI